MSALFIYMLKWACCLTLLYSLYRFMLSKETFHRVNRIVLLGILVFSMLLPLLTVPLNRPVKINVWQTEEKERTPQSPLRVEIKEERPDPLPISLESGELKPSSKEDLEAPSSVPSPPTGRNLLLLLLGITYIIGVVIAWRSYLWSFISLHRVIARSEPVDYRDLPHGVRLLRNADVTIPFSWFRWIVIGEEDTEKQRAIIVHEMSHFQRWHSADMMLCDFTINMLWWLPVSWMLRNDLRNVHEYEADSCVLASGVDSTLYQQLIIEKATSKSKRTIANNFNQSEVKNRLAMMLRGKSKRKSLLKLLYLLPALLIAILLVAKFSKDDQKAQNAACVGLTVEQYDKLTENVKQRVTGIYNEVLRWYNTNSLPPAFNGLCTPFDSPVIGGQKPSREGGKNGRRPNFDSKAYLTQGFAQVIAISDSIAVSLDGIGLIDYDHWTMGQDWDKVSMKIDSVRIYQGEYRAYAYITITNLGNDIPVKLDLHRTNDWYIDDFTTTDGDGNLYALSEHQTRSLKIFEYGLLAALQGSWEYVSTHPDCYPYDSTYSDICSHYIFEGDTLVYPQRCDPTAVAYYHCTIEQDGMHLKLIHKQPGDDFAEEFRIALCLRNDTLYTTEYYPNSEPLYYVNVNPKLHTNQHYFSSIPGHYLSRQGEKLSTINR